MAEPLRLEALTAAESCVLLMRRARRAAMDGKEEGDVVASINDLETSEQEALRRIADEQLGGLPLALEQAGAYLDRNSRVSFCEYSQMLSQNSAPTIFAGKASRLPLGRSVASVASWINIESISAEAQRLLRALVAAGQRGALMPERLVRAIVGALAEERAGRRHTAGGSEREMQEWFFSELMFCASIVQEVGDGQHRCFTIHRLLYDVVEEDGQRTDAAEVPWPALLSGLSTLVWPKERLAEAQAAERAELSELLPHLAAASRFAMEAERAVATEERAALDKVTLFAAQIAKDVNCDYNLARQLLKRYLAGQVASTAHTAEVLQNLGAVLYDQGDVAGALSKFEESLAMRREVHDDKPHPDIASSLHSIGLVLREQGDLAGALSKLEESLAMRRDVYGDRPHPDIARTMHSIGVVLRRQGDLAGALSKFGESLAMRHDVHGDKPHPGICFVAERHRPGAATAG